MDGVAAPPVGLSVSPAATADGEIVVALEAGELAPPAAPGAGPGAEVAAPFAGFTATVLGASRRALRGLVQVADRRGARVAVLLRAGPRGERSDGLGALVVPVLESGFDWVCPAYRRGKLEGMLNTAIVYPLVRALFGRRVRQPCGGEAALSLRLVRALVAAPGWRRIPEERPEAWLAVFALSGPFRVAQAWLGRWMGDAGPADDASHALAGAVGPVFDEMVRHADRWQRVEGSESVPSFGEPGPPDDARSSLATAELEAAFRLGLRELGALWAHVLPPATMLALRRAAAASPGTPLVSDAIWAKIVYDFGLAYSLRTLDRQQLLRSMTPLYLGWVAGYADDVRGRDGEATEARTEALCQAFEREKAYAIARWRWPDSFDP
jgi:glucosylglycerate synthase